MGFRTSLLGIGVFYSSHLIAGSSSQNLKLLDFCTEQNQPMFVFQNLWTDSPQPARRKHELWVDRDKEVIRAYWWTRSDKPTFLIGSQFSETDFFLCAYRQGERKPFSAYMGRALSSGITLESITKKKTLHFSYTPVLVEQRSYSLRYETRSVKHQILGKISQDSPFTCETTVSSFQLVPAQASQVFEHANRRLSDLAQDIRWDHETEDCRNPKILPYVKAMGINLMFASDRFLSAKMDYSNIQGVSGSLQGKVLNLDMAKQSDLNWDSILLASDQKVLLKEINQRLRLAYGKDAHVENLAECSFTFNSQTLVVSAAPQGVHADRVDIPIPLDHIFGILKIKPHGPLAQP